MQHCRSCWGTVVWVDRSGYGSSQLIEPSNKSVSLHHYSEPGAPSMVSSGSGWSQARTLLLNKLHRVPATFLPAVRATKQWNNAENTEPNGS